MTDDDIGTLQAAVEHLRSVRPDEEDMDGRARRADAAFRIAYKLEQIAKRRQAAAPQGREACRETLKRILVDMIQRNSNRLVVVDYETTIDYILALALALTPAVAGAGEATINETERDWAVCRVVDAYRAPRNEGDERTLSEFLADEGLKIAALAQAQQPGEDADQIALDAAHQIEALSNDLHKTQKTARIQLLILAAMNASSRTKDATEGYNPADDRMQFPRKKPDAS